MDRSTIQNLFLLNGFGAGGGQGVDPSLDEPQRTPSNDILTLQSTQSLLSGAYQYQYPSLIQHYLQQHQQAVSSAVMPQLGQQLGITGLTGYQNPAGGTVLGLQSGGFAFGNAIGLNQRLQLLQNNNDVSNLNFIDANRLLLQGLPSSQPLASAETSGLDVSGQADVHGLNNTEPGGPDPYAEKGILGPWSATSAGLLGKMASSSSNEAKSKKVRKKPKDKPKRPLSAYNIFFKEERMRILTEIPEDNLKKSPSADGKQARKRKKNPHGKIGFENLAKVIGQRWQDLSPEQVEKYKKKADEDTNRYKVAIEAYLVKQGKEEEGGKSDEEELEEKPAKKVKTGYSENEA